MSLFSAQPILHPSKRHPLTGALLEAVGVLPNGKVIWPILGGDDSNPPVERPEGVTEEEWEALGDPGKRAIVRERERAEKAEREFSSYFGLMPDADMRRITRHDVAHHNATFLP